MNATRDPDAILVAWLEEGPTDLPDGTRRAILGALPTTKQARRGPFAPGRPVPMNTFTRFAAAAVVAALAIGGAIYLLGPRSSIGPPAASPTASPTPGPTAITGVADAFPHPFSYLLPPDSGIEVTVTDPTWYQFRVLAEPGASSAYAHSVIVRVISGGRVDPCAETSGPLPLPGGPQAVIEYLKSVPTLQVSDESAATIDGRPGARASIVAGGASADCPDLWLWAEEGSFTQNLGRDVRSRIQIVDIDGDHIVILGGGEGDPEWDAIAEAFIASIQFIDSAPSPSSPPLP